MYEHQLGPAGNRVPLAPTLGALSRASVLGQRSGRAFDLRDTSHSGPAGRVMHDFGRMNIHPPGRGVELADDSACASGRFGKNGGTGCDASTGKTVTNIYDPPACYRHCVERHEAVHARDIAPCCTRANTAYKAAQSDDAKQAIQDKFDQWMLSNQDWLECRAYTESAKCGKEYVDNNCGGKKQDAGSRQDISGPDTQPPVSLEPLGAGKAAPNAGNGEPGMLAEDKPDGGAGSPVPSDKGDAGAATPGPEQCCRQVLCYWRVSQGRADNVCDGAPKTMSRCPF